VLEELVPKVVDTHGDGGASEGDVETGVEGGGMFVADDRDEGVDAAPKVLLVAPRLLLLALRLQPRRNSEQRVREGHRPDAAHDASDTVNDDLRHLLPILLLSFVFSHSPFRCVVLCGSDEMDDQSDNQSGNQNEEIRTRAKRRFLLKRAISDMIEDFVSGHMLSSTLYDHVSDQERKTSFVVPFSPSFCLSHCLWKGCAKRMKGVKLSLEESRRSRQGV